MNSVFQTAIIVFMCACLSACASLSAKNTSIDPNGPLPATAPAREISKSTHLKPGRLAIIQGPTSETETLINLFVPRLKTYKYLVKDSAGQSVPVDHYETVNGPQVFYKIDKLKITGLKPGVEYHLTVVDPFRGAETIVDERTFATLKTSAKEAKFALLSCMADDQKFESVIDPMWAKLEQTNPDFIILNGDVVYVDSFDFVARTEATESDIWQRYIDTFRRLPLYHWSHLKPLFATWDDHDFGTNDGDRNFKSKDASKKLFRALFSGPAVAGTWQEGPNGVSSEITAFGQRFYLMDDRTFRQPNKRQGAEPEQFGHWGEPQHQWVMKSLAQNATPAWVINGNQMFSGKSLGLKEAFEENHPRHFVKFINDLKDINAPVIFGSGDVHFSEIMRVPQERIGYETYELSSSAMHSHVGDGWDNPMRLPGASTLEFNFMLIHSRVEDGSLKVDVQSIGIASKPYFEQHLTVKRQK